MPPRLVVALAPKGLFICLDVAPQAVVRRKNELNLEKAASLRTSYLKTSSMIGAAIIDAEKGRDEVFTDLLTQVSSEFIRRIEARLGVVYGQQTRV
jgi:hypothetical protein